ncbi:unnamed protein product [Penicillium salamii]|nr:unnamed protein product [Penicillium salamii]CAG8239345.1 unnamed protein product [Penicillium salamii]CAG8403302.1 unnamed protein product [Penicillium salamii]
MDRLPTELLLTIGRHTQQDRCPQSTIYSLSLCCRRFHNIFSPLMYSYISSDTFSEKFIYFIMRIWREPELARQVHRLDLCWSQCDQHDPLEVDQEMDCFIDAALNEIFSAKERKQRKEWKLHLRGEEGLCAEAWLGLLLVRLPNLRMIQFEHEVTELISDLLLKAVMRQQPFQHGVPFPHLQEVRACVAWGASWIDSDFLTPFFQFPAVRRLYGTAIGEKRPDNSLKKLIHRVPCPVREIVIEEGYWCRGMLDWLALCTDLERISIGVEFQADEYEIEEDEAFNAATFRVAILPFAKTLRSLRIWYGDSYNDQLEETEAVETPFGSLRAFTALQQLTFRHDHLIRLSCDGATHRDSEPLSDSLPQSLVSLEITDIVIDSHIELKSELSKLLLSRSSFPHLRQIRLCITNEDEDELDHMFNGLKLEYQTAGIKLIIGQIPVFE